MKTQIALALAACFAVANAQALTKTEYDAGRNQIKSAYDMDSNKCKSLSGNARDICREETRGKRDVAYADLKAKYEPTPANQYAMRKAKADAEYAVLKERCDDKSGNDKDVCRKDAKAVHTKMLGDAKVAEASMETGRTSKTTTETKAEANKDVREAAYKADVERCDSLSGDAKSKCVADAKLKYGM